MVVVIVDVVVGEFGSLHVIIVERGRGVIIDVIVVIMVVTQVVYKIH